VIARLLVTASPGEVRVAAVRDERFVDYAIWRPGAPDGVGDLHRGRIIARVPAMAGAFVALEDAEGFLPDTEGAGTYSEGDSVAVRVTRAAQSGKGPRLTARLTVAEAALVGAGPPSRLGRGPNPMERLAALWPEAPVLVDDLQIAAPLRAAVGERLSIVDRAFDEAAEAEAEALETPEVAIPGGGRMTIEPTAALVAIDVDAVGRTADRGAKRSAQAAFNRTAIAEAARQIRLRNLGGAIVMDLAGMPARQRARLGAPLAAALADDPLQPRYLGVSALGLVEILRPRVHPPLHDVLSGPHAAGLRGLRALAREAAARPALAWRLCASPGVSAALAADRSAANDVLRRTGRPLLLRSDPTMPPHGWSLEEVRLD
jgi:Ribonuclease G/E